MYCATVSSSNINCGDNDVPPRERRTVVATEADAKHLRMSMGSRCAYVGVAVKFEVVAAKFME